MKVLVVGDVMLDKYIYCSVDRVSPEASTLIAKEENVSFKLGGVANIAYGLTKLNVDVSILGVLGDDDSGQKLVDLFNKIGINNHCIFDGDRKTTVKSRFLDAKFQHLLRHDSESNLVVEQGIQKSIIDYIIAQEDNFDGIILADYDKGVIKEYLVDTIAELNTPVFADLKPQQINVFHGLEAIAPNIFEVMRATELQLPYVDEMNDPKYLKNMAKILAEKSKNVIITLGNKGMYFYNKTIDECIDVNHYVVQDTCGCGDVVTLVYAYAALEGNNPLCSAKIANMAAAMTTEKIGVANIDILEYENIKLYIE